ncbi:sterol desaturase family protein [Sphingobium sp.]|uniref:sterol desaturase family protein n=1 Tax=Sphingobium sp. TaxID=1912891 RepID=UPI002C9D4999|nr:sterol desaturase family protein [Sphingobium sp.]HUD93823.1 sterol desaturase family protein [Sphingobium sp.]
MTVALAPLILPLILFGLLERLAPAGPLKSARGWWLNLRLMLLYLGVPTLFGFAIKAAVTKARSAGNGGFLDLFPIVYSTGMLALIAGCLLAILIWDFFYYWWHRAQHSISWLWRIHCLHHMDETLGVSANMRVHWLEEIGRTLAIFLPMALLFNLPAQTGLVALAITVWGAFVHSNLRLQLGWASPIIAGPQLHRIHHSRLVEHHDRNFSAFLPVWDVLFGTYHHPKRGEFPPTGVEGRSEVSSIWEAVILPFRRDWTTPRP